MYICIKFLLMYSMKDECIVFKPYTMRRATHVSYIVRFIFFSRLDFHESIVAIRLICGRREAWLERKRRSWQQRRLEEARWSWPMIDVTKGTAEKAKDTVIVEANENVMHTTEYRSIEDMGNDQTSHSDFWLGDITLILGCT